MAFELAFLNFTLFPFILTNSTVTVLGEVFTDFKSTKLLNFIAGSSIVQSLLQELYIKSRSAKVRMRPGFGFPLTLIVHIIVCYQQNLTCWIFFFKVNLTFLVSLEEKKVYFSGHLSCC